jgi:hypothetical protein
MKATSPERNVRRTNADDSRRDDSGAGHLPKKSKKKTSPRFRWLVYRIAVGATVEPVAPCSFSGWMTKANS